MDHDKIRAAARHDYCLQPVDEDLECTVYNTLDYNNADHRKDLLESMTEQDLVCVCDEDAGGIIAYAQGENNAVFIAQALLFYRQHLDQKK